MKAAALIVLFPSIGLLACDSQGDAARDTSLDAPTTTTSADGVPSQPSSNTPPAASDSPSTPPDGEATSPIPSATGSEETDTQRPPIPDETDETDATPDPTGADAAGGASSGMAGGGGAGAGGAAADGAGTGGAGGSSTADPELQTAFVYVGGYGDDYPLGIYSLDKAEGTLTSSGSSTDAGSNPSYLAVFGRTLYAANERDDSQGGLTALSIADDGSLSRLNHQTGSDGGFAHVAIDPSGSFALAASYNGGSVSLFPIEDDGALGPELDNVDFGDEAQSHCVGFDPSGAFVFVPNKGNDEIAQLVLGTDGSLTPNTPPQIATAAGAGPRHIAISDDGSRAWVMNELSSTMTPYQLNDAGTLSAGTPVSTRANGSNGQNTGAHVEITPDARFVYGSNRGDDTLAVFAADPVTAELTLVEHEPTRGAIPRDFEMDPEGDLLIVANQDSQNLAMFSIASDGSLDPLGDVIEAPPLPVAVQLVYLP